MIKLKIEQDTGPLLSFYHVYDEQGETLFVIESKFELGAHLFVRDPDGECLAEIKRRLPSVLPVYELTIGGEQAGRITKRVGISSYKAEPIGWETKGDIFGLQYNVKCGGELVLAVNKPISAFGDTYDLKIYDEQNVMMAVLMTVVFDISQHRGDGTE